MQSSYISKQLHLKISSATSAIALSSYQLVAISVGKKFSPTEKLSTGKTLTTFFN
jgi:hypothetical protein